MLDSKSQCVEVHIDSSKQKTGTVKTLGMGPYPLPSYHLLVMKPF